MGSAFFVGEEHFQAALNAAAAEGKDCPLRIHWRGNAKVVAAAPCLQVAFLLPANGCPLGWAPQLAPLGNVLLIGGERALMVYP